MNRKSLILAVTLALAFSSRAALQFRVITNTQAAGLTDALLAAVTDGSRFVAVGSNSAGIAGVFGSSLVFSASPTGSSPGSGGRAERALLASPGLFLGSGVNNDLFSSPDGLNWTADGKIVGNSSVTAMGLAYNQGANRFAAVLSSFQIRFADASATPTWIVGTNTASFAEGYRAVTPFGSGFALSGTLGVVRVSANGGANWYKVRDFFLNTSEPDLLGIAADSSTTLVAVGTKSRILYTPNGFTAFPNNPWVTVNWATGDQANRSLNAVAYSSPGFVAVGDGGEIVTSPDGLNGWGNENLGALNTNGLPASLSTNLYGVTFASSGQLAGVGMIVGAGGTVILAGYTPPSPILTAASDILVCENAPLPSTNTLSVDINTTDAHFPPGTLTIDWFDQAGQPASNTVSTSTSSSVLFTTDSSVSNPNQVKTNLFYAQARDLRTGFISPRVTVTLRVKPRPHSVLASTNSGANFFAINCNNPTNYTITNILTGIGPWVVTWNDLFSETVGTGSGPFTYTRTVAPFDPFTDASSNNVFFIATITNTETCVNNAQAGDFVGMTTIIVNPLPTATLISTNDPVLGLFTATVCNGSSAFALTNILHGIGPWTITWNDGFSATVGSGAGPFTNVHNVIPIDPSQNAVSNNVFFVANLTDANCTANGGLYGTNIITVNPRPKAILLSTNNPVLARFDITNCNDGTSFNITNILTGIGPWTVTWNDLFTETVGSGAGPYTNARVVMPLDPLPNDFSNNVFYITSVSNADTCVANGGDISGTNSIRVNPLPTATLLSTNFPDLFAFTNCDIATVFSITNQFTGLGPWVVTWNDGVTQSVTALPGNPGLLVRSVTPTVASQNAASNNVFYVAAISNVCSASSIVGTNVITINPRPTTSLLSTNIPALARFSVTNCNDGTSFTITNILTGIGPWTIAWNDAFTETVGSGPGPFTNARPVIPFDPFANNFSNNVFYIMSVSNADTCVANTGDITGTNIIRVNPLSTATLLSTNSPGLFATTNCNVGTPYSITNELTGLGPWNVTWNDGFPQAVNTNAGSPARLVRTVLPSTSQNATSNNIFYIASISNVCPATSITGTNILTVNPVPTSTLLNAANVTNCNSGGPYTLTNVLTGIAPWTMIWNDGTPQTVLTGNAPVTNTYTVFPTNVLANAVTNFTFAVTNLTGGGCVGTTTGTNHLRINPVPTALLTLTTNDFRARTSRGTNLLVLVTNAFGTNIDVRVRFSFPSNHSGHTYTVTVTNLTLFVTNRASLTGVSPWTVGWSDSYATNTVSTNNAQARFVFQEVIQQSNPTTNYFFSIASLKDANNCPVSSADLQGGISVSVNRTPSADVNVVGSGSICSGETAQIQVDLGGIPPWKIFWADGVTNNNVTTTPFFRSVTLTNNTTAAITNTYAVTNLTDAISSTSDTNDLGMAVVQVDPIPGAPPQSLGNKTSCFDVATTLAVSVPPGFTADWYADLTGTNQLASGTTNFTPAVPVTMGTNGSVTNVYFVAARYDDDGLTNSCRSGFTNVTLISVLCTNQLSITRTTTNILTEFSGNYTLQNATNLQAPVYWQTLTQGVAGRLTTWTNSFAPPPTNNFFRLVAPQTGP